MSYDAGEIDFFRLAQSLDRALEIELTYLENLNRYNQQVLEINYMTLENE
jgi:cobalt-zinc-cadmium resistance protein CzcA